MEITDEIRRQVIREMASKGGKTTFAKYGHEHFVTIGKKGGAVVKESIKHYREWKAQNENPS